MAKSNFSERVYKKAREVLTTQSFDPQWQAFLEGVVHANELFGDGGPSVLAQNGLIKFREELESQARRQNCSVAKIMIAAAKAGKPDSKWNLRVAFFCILLHFSRHAKRGAQDVWIYSPPEAFLRWIFEEIQGSEAKIEAKLQKGLGIFSEVEKDLMVQALQIALACSQKTEALLANPDERCLAVVARWFGDAQTGPAELAAIVSKLLTGFKKITNVCNSNNLIFSDNPRRRKEGFQYNRTYASVSEGGEDNLKVMYIEGLFKKAANSGALWLCAQTIIHEASHLELGTQDIRYDVHGLKPCDGFRGARAIENADSWGYFCIDLCGYLSQSDLQKTCR